MAAAHETVPGPDRTSKVDKYSIIIAAASLVVSLVALVVSLYTWIHARPADPTLIPTFGKSDAPETIDARDGGRRFFAFLDKHPGRKVRIIATIGEGVDVEQTDVEKKNLTSTHFTVRHECKREQVYENEPDCDADVLVIRSEDEGKEKFGLEWQSGWVLEGYFANAGLVSRRQGLAHREIIGISIVTAVS